MLPPSCSAICCRTLLALLALAPIAPTHSIAAQEMAGVSKAVLRSIPATPDKRHVFVLDSAHLMSQAEIAALQDSAIRLQRETHADVAFVTLPTLHGGAVEEAALAIGRAWKIGSAGAPGDPARNRGLVMLYVPDKKSVAGANLRVEIGRGLEGAITDGGGSRAILEAIKPPFRAKRYGEGFVAGFNVAAQLIAAEKPTLTIAPPPKPESTESGFNIPPMVIGIELVIVLFVILIVITRLRRRRGRAGAPRYQTSRDHVPAAMIAPILLEQQSFARSNDDDRHDDSSSSSSDDSSSSDNNSSSSDGGDFGGGGGFSGGGSSDSV
ncbi:MAG: TPM domain-containing protein [bacterium]